MTIKNTNDTLHKDSAVKYEDPEVQQGEHISNVFSSRFWPRAMAIWGHFMAVHLVIMLVILFILFIASA